MAALSSVGAIPRSFVTGRWGCGAFGGDVELKFVIQWGCCSANPSTERMVFCPFERGEALVDAGVHMRLHQFRGKPARHVLDLLLREDYADTKGTLSYLIERGSAG